MTYCSKLRAFYRNFVEVGINIVWLLKCRVSSCTKHSIFLIFLKVQLTSVSNVIHIRNQHLPECLWTRMSTGMFSYKNVLVRAGRQTYTFQLLYCKDEILGRERGENSLVLNNICKSSLLCQKATQIVMLSTDIYIITWKLISDKLMT